jgi:glycosyltransferase involved in cell wall biosynthesis
MRITGQQPVRVCQLISSFRPVIGGAERATEQLSSVLRKEGVDVIVFTRRKSSRDVSFEEINGIPVYRLGQPGLGKWGALTYAIRSFWLLATSFRHYRIVHAQSPDTPFFIGLFSKFLLGRKLILTIHGGNRIRDYLQSLSGKLRLYAIRSFVDRYTAITQEVQEQLFCLGVPASHIELIPNGIDANQFMPADEKLRKLTREHLNLPAVGRIVVFIGRLHPIKRVDLLLRAWARVQLQPQDQLLIVGVGEELGRLQALAAQLNISVRFEGPAAEVVHYLHAADIFVLPSGIHSTASYEGLSVALMEAMSAGLAVVATDCSGNRVLIRNSHNGLLFPMEDVDGLTRQLNRLLEDPALRTHLGQNAHTSVVNDYAIDVVAHKTELLYSQIQNFVAVS